MFNTANGIHFEIKMLIFFIFDPVYVNFCQSGQTISQNKMVNITDDTAIIYQTLLF